MKDGKMKLQLFGVPENETVESWLDMLGDHGDLTANMSDGAVALLVIASRLENMSEVLEERLADQGEKLDKIADSLEHIDYQLGLLTDCVGHVPPQKGYVQTEGYKFLRIGGGVDVE